MGAGFGVHFGSDESIHASKFKLELDLSPSCAPVFRAINMYWVGILSFSLRSDGLYAFEGGGAEKGPVGIARFVVGLGNPLYKGKELKERDQRSVTVAAAEAGEWTAIWSEEHSRFYYYSKASSVTTWEKPSGFVDKSGSCAD